MQDQPQTDIDNNATIPRVGRVDVSNYHNVHSIRNRIARLVWGFVWVLLFRLSPRICNGWRRFLLRLFGAKIAKHANIGASCKIWAPWNLTMQEYSCLASNVDCYCAAPITVGAHSTVSQYSYLCSASHDFTRPAMPLTMAPIVIEDQVWVCADVFIGPGVTVGQGAVVGARSTVFKDVEPWKVVAGNPARIIKERVMKGE